MFSNLKYLLDVFLSKKPVEVVFPVTYRCDSKCRMCDRWKLANREEELSLSQISSIFTKLHDFGIRRATITGGEPLLRKDIIKILQTLSIMGVKPILNTSGTLFNEKIIEELIEIDGINIIVSLDTLNKEVYHYMRGVDKLERVIENIKLFKKIAPNFPLRIHMVITQVNYKEVNNLLLFSQKNKLKFSAMPYNYEARFENKDESIMYNEQINEITNIFYDLSNLTHKDYVSGFKILYSKAADWINNVEVGRCNAGRETLYLNVDGRVAPCADLAYFGDLKKDNIRDVYDPSIWEHEVKKCCEHPACFVGCYWGLAILKDNKIAVIKELLNLKKMINILRGKEY